MAIPKLLELMRNSASKEYVDNNGGSFEATYGVTTYEKIIEAFNQGKIITCNCYQTESLPSDFLALEGIYSLTTYPTGTNTLYFYNDEVSATNNYYANTEVAYVAVNSDSTWDYGYGPIGKVAIPIYTDSAITTPFYESNTNSYYRPIICSTSEPTADDGKVGDIWIQYEE